MLYNLLLNNVELTPRSWSWGDSQTWYVVSLVSKRIKWMACIVGKGKRKRKDDLLSSFLIILAVTILCSSKDGWTRNEKWPQRERECGVLSVTDSVASSGRLMLRAVLMSQPLRQHGGNWTHRYILVDNLSLGSKVHRILCTYTHARAVLSLLNGSSINCVVGFRWWWIGLLTNYVNWYHVINISIHLKINKFPFVYLYFK